MVILSYLIERGKRWRKGAKKAKEDMREIISDYHIQPSFPSCLFLFGIIRVIRIPG